MATNLTNDTGIACIGGVDRNVAVAKRSILMANLERVGTLRETIGASYLFKPKAIMIGNLIKELNVTRDAHGMTMDGLDGLNRRT